MDIKNIANQLKGFRHALYDLFDSRRDASMELVDALSSNPYSNSVVHLSLVECYRRNYCSITRSLDEFYQLKTPEAKTDTNNSYTELLATYCPVPVVRRYYVFGVDCTPAPRVHAQTVKDRGMVHQPTKISGNKPITIGHEYSVMACLPDKSSTDDAAWIWPLSCHRVTTEEKGTLIGMQQIHDVIVSDEKFKETLCVSVADSAYSDIACLNMATRLDNQIHISRLKNNRVLCHPAPVESSNVVKRGRPKTYGEKFILRDELTWGEPSDKTVVDSETKKGMPIKVHIECWDNILMRGTRKTSHKKISLRVVRIKICKPNGELLFKKPLWEVVVGKRKNELSLNEIYDAYRQRFDIEHFFRFGKNRLLMDKFQTPDVDHADAWWQMVMLSYAQLFLGKSYAEKMPTPWEKYLPEYQNSTPVITPTQVQRDFGRIIREFGTPAKPPKLRNKSKGRQKGELQNKRTRHPVVLKGKKDALKQAA